MTLPTEMPLTGREADVLLSQIPAWPAGEMTHGLPPKTVGSVIMADTHAHGAVTLELVEVLMRHPGVSNVRVGHWRAQEQALTLTDDDITHWLPVSFPATPAGQIEAVLRNALRHVSVGYERSNISQAHLEAAIGRPQVQVHAEVTPNRPATAVVALLDRNETTVAVRVHTNGDVSLAGSRDDPNPAALRLRDRVEPAAIDIASWAAARRNLDALRARTTGLFHDYYDATGVWL